MRLWHKELILVLPRQQLISQWRECCCIIKNISTNGTPNHLLVNKIMNYPLSHLYTYGCMVASEMKRRGYKCGIDRFAHYFTYPHETNIVSIDNLFDGWHNTRYLIQCFYNLQEKYDCGGINTDEWLKILYYCNKHISTVNYINVNLYIIFNSMLSAHHLINNGLYINKYIVINKLTIFYSYSLFSIINLLLLTD